MKLIPLHNQRTAVRTSLLSRRAGKESCHDESEMPREHSGLRFHYARRVKTFLPAAACFHCNPAWTHAFIEVEAITTQMKRRFLITTLTTIAALPILAQGPRRFEGGPRGLDFLAGYLTLTESQKTQAQTIFDAANTASETARGQLTSAREALQVAVKANRADTELDRLAAAVGTVEGQLAGIQAKASAKFYNLLTPEQKTKYDQLRTRSGPPGRR
jgi:Spy/CpxP family protein refolding chaperone